MQDSSLHTPPETPAVLTDAEHTSENLQIDEASSLNPGSTEKIQTEKAKIESEMDPSDISNVSAARLVRNLARILNKKQ